MRVLWITNIPLPPLCEKEEWPVPAIGGWMYSSAKRLIAQGSIQLSVATPGPRGAGYIDTVIDGVRYFAIPYGWHSTTKNHKFVQDYWKKIYSEVYPDVIHIHGTEYAQGNDYILACGGNNVVVSIQGLVGAYSHYYYGGIQSDVVRRQFTIRDILRRATIVDGCKDFERRGEIEKDTIRRVKHIIGRTEWDKAHAWAINPDAQYHYCGETLRDVFYHNQWDYEKCEKHSIFVGQAHYPLKGLHQVLEALPLVLRQYPDTKLYVAGADITKSSPWYRYTGYGRYIKKLVKKLGLQEHVFFTGFLNEERMCERYLNSNVFVCPSAIENSPNSLGEAQLLGMPYLCSYVGGSMDLVAENYNALYRFEEKEILAHKLCNIFELGEKAAPTNRESIIWRYDPQKNISDLLKVYKEVVQTKVEDKK